MTDVNKTYYGDHFTMHTNIESSCTLETNTLNVSVNYASIKNNWKIKNIHICNPGVE